MVDLRFPNQDLRNKDYKDLAAGDETHRHGDYIPYDLKETPDHEIGDLVEIDSANEDLQKWSSGDATLLGVHYSNYWEADVATGPDYDNTVDTSEDGTVKSGGAAIVRLEDSQFDTDVDTDVTVGEPLGPNGRGIVLHLSDEDPDNDNTYYAEILL